MFGELNDPGSLLRYSINATVADTSTVFKSHQARKIIHPHVTAAIQKIHIRYHQAMESHIREEKSP